MHSNTASTRPYPAQHEETLQWAGQAILLRPIRAEDEGQHAEFLASLDPEDIRLRVFNSRRAIEPAELARLTHIDYEREMVFIAQASGPDGKPRTLGVVRAVTDHDNRDAEFAIIVRSELKGRGLGQLLLAKMIGYARSRGTLRLMGIVLRENESMLKLARDNGFELDGREGALADETREITLAL
jgi:acetyltransferase